MRRPTLVLIAILTTALAATPVAAQQTATDPAAEATPAGFLFAYRPHADAQAEFYDGYRAHLDWHRERADSLDWYGWDILAGPGLGLFVDGVFGTYTVEPRGLEGLEAAARTVRSEAEDRGYLPYTVYENLAGAEPGLVFMVWRDRLGSFDTPDRDPTRALHRHLAGTGSTADAEVVSEVWRFRRDLTYYGSEETPRALPTRPSPSVSWKTPPGSAPIPSDTTRTRS